MVDYQESCHLPSFQFMWKTSSWESMGVTVEPMTQKEASKFEAIFRKHARSYPNALTKEELQDMLKANREPKDYAGWIGAWTEWKVLYSLCKDKDGLLHKETIRAAYDGSLFQQMAKEKASRTKTA
ncbi:putative peroxygenase 4 [Asimina triloba]